MADSVELPAKLVQLFTSYPCAGSGKADFSLAFPVELSDRAYEVVVKQIEFRKKCMNQGFDNLLELLAIHKEGFDKTTKVVDEMNE